MEHKELWLTTGEVDESAEPLTIGKAAIRKTGKDISLLSWSKSANDCVHAAELLAKESIDAEVIDLRTLWPWDRDTVFASIEKTQRVLVVHESTKVGGFGGELLAEISENFFGKLQSAPTRLGSPRIPVPYAKNLEDLCRVDATMICQAVQKLVQSR